MKIDRIAHRDDVLDFTDGDIEEAYRRINELATFLMSRGLGNSSKYVSKASAKVGKEVNERKQPRNTLYGYFEGC